MWTRRKIILHKLLQYRHVGSLKNLETRRGNKKDCKQLKLHPVLITGGRDTVTAEGQCFIESDCNIICIISWNDLSCQSHIMTVLQLCPRWLLFSWKQDYFRDGHFHHASDGNLRGENCKSAALLRRTRRNNKNYSLPFSRKINNRKILWFKKKGGILIGTGK